MPPLEARNAKKRVKKIIKKLRREALDCQDYERGSHKLLEIQQLIEKERVSPPFGSILTI